jgi:hypothetical protein
MDFQTPPIVCNYMVSLMPFGWCGTILEPHPGSGNLVKVLNPKGTVITYERFENIPAHSWYDWIVMNPPFTPMKEGYRYLLECMNMTDNLIVLLPWLVIINSDIRLKEMMHFGLVSITCLPRKAFPRSRIQTCIVKMERGYLESTVLKRFSW